MGTDKTYFNFNSVREWINTGMPFNSFVLGDCNEAMKTMPNNFVDLALVDPPYGIGMDGGKREYNEYEKKNWDTTVPDDDYFDELFRVSKHQIIWGGNYYKLDGSKCFIVWDKTLHGNTFADCEMAWASFDKVARIYKLNICHIEKNYVKRIHPTQKPIKLYQWCLINYGQAGWKILDTHVGSGSSLIACEREGFDYVGFEIDPDYYKAAKERIERERMQLTLKLH